MATTSAGGRWWAALETEKPLQCVGVVNALHARMAERAGFRALYLSGAGVAAASLGLPDLGLSSLEDVLVDVRRITDVCLLPLLVDADTGFGTTPWSVARTTKALVKQGAAAMHLEHQVATKRCGHRPGKQLVTASEMGDRIKAAVDARPDPTFCVMARTDAIAVEGLGAAIERACRYVEAGADAIFAEAAGELDHYAQFARAAQVPVLANLTEFGKTPLFTTNELRAADVAIALYPLSAFRAMNRAAGELFGTLRRSGTQREAIDSMQTRAELYELLDYHAYETKLDEQLSKGNTP